MRLLTLAVLTVSGLGHAIPFFTFPAASESPVDTLCIAARDLLQTFETTTPAEQQAYILSHCDAFSPATLSAIAKEADVAALLDDHGVKVETVIAYVAAVCGK
ncbi:hypothetical protein FB451DRAFT_245235 [Mycena latifolia]|nr:hypothetical protein FB451DRAFT_245235 [Mycena latifolia]